ncbi:flavodoxin domain-containing protein [Phenylobacterium sp.]|uniref:flavodoxin domain-containing protein n=1 Tax=Phenylobacterium sp. TaxID=1871053 RepID=UPI002EDA8B89
MRILMIYGTTEGHTRELCNFAASRLRERDLPTTVEEAGHDPHHPDPSPYDVVFLAASLHVGRYQPRLMEYARTHHATLNKIRSAFISVSLSAAGENPHDWEGLEQCLARFEHETLWTPSAVHHAAGAIRYSQYDFFKRLAMKHIAAKRGQRTVLSRDYDLTDYDALSRFVLDFVGAPAAAADAKAG